MVDAKLADHIVTWAQTTLRNAVRENLEAPAKHFQYYCEHFLLNLNSCLLFVLAFFVLAERFMMTCVFISSVVDNYDWLVNGSAQNLVEKFMEEEHSFHQYTEVELNI